MRTPMYETPADLTTSIVMFNVVRSRPVVAYSERAGLFSAVHVQRTPLRTVCPDGA